MGDKIGATTEEKRTTQQNHIHTQEINKPNPVKRKKEKGETKKQKATRATAGTEPATYRSARGWRQRAAHSRQT